MSQEVAFQKRDDANRIMPIGLTLLGVGVAALGGGVLWWLLDDEHASEAIVIPAPDGVTAVWRF